MTRLNRNRVAEILRFGVLWEPYKLEIKVYISCVRLLSASVEISEQEWCEKILAFWWQHEQESSGCSGVFFIRLWKITVQWVAVVKFRMNDRSGDGTGSFEVKVRTMDEDSEVHEYDNSKIVVASWLPRDSSWRYALVDQHRSSLNRYLYVR